MLSAFDRIHCPPSNGMPVRHHRNPHRRTDCHDNWQDARPNIYIQGLWLFRLQAIIKPYAKSTCTNRENVVAFLEFKPTQTVYKYCSSDGFLGIVKSKRLWFTDLASANDPREIKLGYELFAEAINLVRQEDLKGLRGAFLTTLAKQLAYVHATQQAFSCCFSLVADELPMWNEYGKNYSGLAIGFRPSALFGVPCRIQRANYLDAATIAVARCLLLTSVGPNPREEDEEHNAGVNVIEHGVASGQSRAAFHDGKLCCTCVMYLLPG